MLDFATATTQVQRETQKNYSSLSMAFIPNYCCSLVRSVYSSNQRSTNNQRAIICGLQNVSHCTIHKVQTCRCSHNNVQYLPQAHTRRTSLVLEMDLESSWIESHQNQMGEWSRKDLIVWISEQMRRQTKPCPLTKQCAHTNTTNEHQNMRSA